MVKDWEDKSATAICMAAFCDGPDGEAQIFKGSIRGQIIEPRGSGFGFPCFLPDGYDRTLAEMEDYEKNRISHRFHSLNALRKFLMTFANTNTITD